MALLTTCVGVWIYVETTYQILSLLGHVMHIAEASVLVLGVGVLVLAASFPMVLAFRSEHVSRQKRFRMAVCLLLAVVLLTLGASLGLSLFG